VSWSTFSTGLNPGRHAIFDFLKRNVDTYQPSFAPSDESTKPFLWGAKNPPILGLIALVAVLLLVWLVLKLFRVGGAKAFAVAGVLAVAAAVGVFVGAKRLLPLSYPIAINRRQGDTFWSMLGAAGKKVRVMRMPVTFPPESDQHGHVEMLSGLGTPDVSGRIGKPFYFTSELFFQPKGGGDFKGEIVQLLEKAGVMIPEEKWFSNLSTRGNTGAASIFIMLDEAFSNGRFKKDDVILLMVPESGRFQVGFAKLRVVDAAGDQASVESPAAERRRAGTSIAGRPPQSRDEESVGLAIANSPLAAIAASRDETQKYLGVELALVWADFERMLRAVPMVQRIEEGAATLEDYKRLLVNLRQQVMEGARWIARAASSVSIELFPLRSMFIGHAGEEHKDYQMLERDFVAVGGTLLEITTQPKNIGSEALSAYMFHHASQPDPLDLLGAMFVIEGLGMKKAGHWADLLREQLRLTTQQTSFLTYHGSNDDDHFARLRQVIESGVLDRSAAESVVKTAKTVARLYALQLEEVDNV